MTPHDQYCGNKRSRRADKRTRMNLHADMAKKNDIGSSNENRRNRDQQIGATHFTLPSGYVCRRCLVRFPDGNAFDSRRVGHLAHLFGSLIVKKFGYIFGRRIDRIKRRLVVQKLVVDVADQISKNPFKVHEITEQAYGIQLFAFHVYAHAIVVSVRVLALAFVTAQRVPSGKCLFYADFKHSFWADRPGLARMLALARCLHEALNFSDVPAEAVFRQRFNENFTILHALDAVIEDGQHAAICSRPNQPAETLFQGQHRFGNLIFRKRVPAVVSERPYARRHNRIGWNGKRQAVDDHTRKLPAGYVHTLPETRGCEKHRIGGRAETFQQGHARRSSLKKHGKPDSLTYELENLIHLGIASE